MVSKPIVKWHQWSHMVVRAGLWGRQSTQELMPLNCGVGKDSWECLGLQGDPTSHSYRKSIPNTHWKDWCWSWSSSISVTWCEQLTHCKVPDVGKIEGRRKGVRGWDGWMASPMQWTWTWANSGKWWGTGRPGMLQSMGYANFGILSHSASTEKSKWQELKS